MRGGSGAAPIPCRHARAGPPDRAAAGPAAPGRQPVDCPDTMIAPRYREATELLMR
jgi:hypothetical protein